MERLSEGTVGTSLKRNIIASNASQICVTLIDIILPIDEVQTTVQLMVVIVAMVGCADCIAEQLGQQYPELCSSIFLM